MLDMCPASHRIGGARTHIRSFVERLGWDSMRCRPEQRLIPRLAPPQAVEPDLARIQVHLRTDQPVGTRGDPLRRTAPALRPGPRHPGAARTPSDPWAEPGGPDTSASGTHSGAAPPRSDPLGDASTPRHGAWTDRPKR